MKQKTHSGAKKRFRATGSGKLVGRKASARHLLTNKSKRQKKMQSKPFGMNNGDTKTVRKLLNI